MEIHNLFPERGFNDQPLYWFTNSGNDISKEYLFNESKIWELPSALLKAQRFKDFAEQVCNLTFIAAAVETGIARDLIAVLREAVQLHSPKIRIMPPFKMSVSKDEISIHTRLEAYTTFLSTCIFSTNNQNWFINKRSTWQRKILRMKMPRH